MRASIIIAAYNEGGALAKTIRTCTDTCATLDHEIVVADDASTDDSVEDAMDRFRNVRFARHERRCGASPTKHLGTRDARGEVLVFLDGHCKPESGAIRRLVEDVELLEGEAIVTPAIPALDVGQWKNDPRQVGRGYRMDLKTFGCGWLPRGRMRAVQEGRRKFFESPALIGCALGISRSLYDRLWGFDAHMRVWGVEDLDLGLKCWLMGARILHDSDARIGHRFRRRFDNYDVPFEHVVVNQLRMACKHFSQSVWAEWLDRCRQRHPGRLPEHPEGLWARVWQLFEQDRSSVEEERSYLQANRARDEFWYAKRFGLNWPRLAAEGAKKFRGPISAEDPSGSPSPSPSPSPPPVSVTFSPDPVKTGFKINTTTSAVEPLTNTITATVAPAARAADIEFVKGGSKPDFTELGDKTVNADGTVTIEVKGLVKSTPTSRTQVLAKLGEDVLRRAEVKVVVPEEISKKNKKFPRTEVTAENKTGDRKSSPVWYVPGDPALKEGEVGLATTWMHVMSVRVDDQFGNPLDAVYDGSDVEEYVDQWIDINQDISGGNYDDPVGLFWMRIQSTWGIPPVRNPAEYVFPATSATAQGWAAAAKPNMPTPPPINQTIPVRVAAHEVGPVKRKLIATSQAGKDYLEIRWNP